MNDSLDSYISPDAEIGAEAPGGEKAKSFLKGFLWTSFGFACLLFFTLLKLPEARLGAFVQGYVQSHLQAQGVRLIAAESKFDIGFGFSYQMSQVQIFLRNSPNPIQLDTLEITPRLTALVVGKASGEVVAKKGQGVARIAFGAPLLTQNGDFSTSFQIDKLDLARTGILAQGVPLRMGATLSATGHLSGNQMDPQSWTGEFKIDPKNLVIEPQSFFGFSIPRTSVSEGDIQVKLDQGKAQIQRFRLGKASNKDDLTATLGGEIGLAQPLAASRLNLRLQFTLSESLKQALTLIDSFIGVGKQPDGSYAFRFSGTAMAPIPQPGG